ncbi:MAG: hypothetical protein H6581_06925 [Bacteroidia bacterium]|nr:hypothetical protein [Bacteroidia bacterium]
MNRISFALFSFSVLFFVACGDVSVTDKTHHGGDTLITVIEDPGSLNIHTLPDATDSNADPKFIQGEFTVEKAMEVVYGYYDKDMECSKWICRVSEKEEFSEKMDEEGNLYTKATANFPFSTVEGKKVMLVTATAGRMGDGWESCHACAPILGLVQFGEIGGDWFVEALQKNLGTVGAWGELPPSEFVKIGPESYAVLFNYGYTSQGFTEGGIRLLGLSGDKFGLLIDRPTQYSNDGYYFEDNHPELAYAFDTKFEFVPGKNKEHFDLKLTSSGTKPLRGKTDGSDIGEFKETVVLQFNGGKYVVKDSNLVVQ